MTCALSLILTAAVKCRSLLQIIIGGLVEVVGLHHRSLVGVKLLIGSRVAIERPKKFKSLPHYFSREVISIKLTNDSPTFKKYFLTNDSYSKHENNIESLTVSMLFSCPNNTNEFALYKQFPSPVVFGNK